MKKMIVTIIILFIIFISMVICKSSAKKSEITVNEIEQIEDYIGKLYAYKEITGEALPEFQDINDADEKWIWGITRENIDDYELDYKKIEETIQELFGNSLNKKYPKEGTEFITYNKEKQKYITKELTIDAIKDSYYIQKIEKNNNEYAVRIVEYLVDYTDEEGRTVKIKNLKEEIIKEITDREATEENITKIVKTNIDKFSKKQVTLEKDGEKLVIKKVEKEK